MNKRLYVGNLSFDSTSDSIRTAFAEHGEVTDVHLVTDRDSGRSRGFGFVTMGTEAEVATAMEKLNGQELDGRALRIDEAQERRPRGGNNWRG